MDLAQGDMSVIEYAAKFDELSRYGYALVDMDIRSNERSIRGLKLELGAMTHIREPYHVMVEMTIQYEEMLAVSAREKPVESQGPQGKKRKIFKKKGAQNGVAAKKAKADLLCFNCDKKGHYAQEPDKRRGEGWRQEECEVIQL